MLARRPMVWFAVVCAVATLVGTRYGASGLRFGIALGIAGLAALAICARQLKPSPGPVSSPLAPRDGWISRLGRNRVLLCAGLLLFSFAQWRAASVWADLRGAEQQLARTFTGRLRVDTPPEQAVVTDGPCFWSCRARLLAVDGEAVEPIAVRLSGYGPAGMLRGDELSGHLLRSAIPPASFPGDFDLRQYLAARGLALSLRFVRDRAADVEAEEAGASYAYAIQAREGVFPGRWLDAIRRSAIRRLLRNAPGEEGRLLAVVLFGYRLTSADEEAHAFREVSASFRDVGIGHLLAISGLHVGLVCGLAWWILGWWIPDRRWRAGLCIGVCLLYLGMSGGRIAAVRASIMAIVYLSGFVLARRSDFPSALGLAACWILLLNPPALQDIGFLLSFTAVLFISRLCLDLDPLLAAGPQPTLREKEGGAGWTAMLRDVGRHIRGLLALSVSAWLGVWPLTALAFFQIHPIGLLANIVALPLMSVVLAAGALVPWVGPLAPVTALPATALIGFAKLLQHIPGGHLPVARPAPVLLLTYYVAFGLFFLRRNLTAEPSRHRVTHVTLGLVVAATVLLVWDMVTPRVPAEVRITLLDAGRGEMVVVQTPAGRNVAVGRLSFGGRDLARMLRAEGHRTVDRVVAFARKPDAAPSSRLTDLVTVERWDVTPLSLNAEEQGGSFGWQRIDPEGGIDLALSRDADGTLVWWALRIEGMTVGLSEWCWPEQLQYRLERKTPGTEAPLVSLRVRGAGEELALAEAMPARWVLLGHEQPEGVPQGVVSRDAVGAVRMERGRGTSPRVRFYNGGRWREASAAMRSLVSPDDKR